MSLLLAFAAALFVAAGFASLAETILCRRSTDVFGWNESFVIGASGGAAVLFPLSLVAPTKALDLVALAVSLSAVAIPWRIARSFRRPPGPGASPPLRLPLALTLSIVPGVLLFTVLCLRTAFAWDAFQIWGTKALLLFRDGGLRPELWPGSLYEGRSGRTVNYPALLPLFEALAARVRGRFDFMDLKPIFPIFFLSLLLSVVRGVRAAASSRALCLSAILVMGFVPVATSRPVLGGNADLPLAACAAALAAAWLAPNPRAGRWNSATPWLLGSLLAAKSEGLILFGAALAAGAIVSAGRLSRAKVRSHAAGAAVALALLAGRIGYLRWTAIQDRTIDPPSDQSLARALVRIPEVARLCGSELMRFREWGFLWPAFLLLALAAVARAPGRGRVVALAALLGTAAYSAIFLQTSWPVRLHVNQAYSRLLFQILPVAVIAMVCGYESLRADRPGETEEGAPAPPDKPGLAGAERQSASDPAPFSAAPGEPRAPIAR